MFKDRPGSVKISLLKHKVFTHIYSVSALVFPKSVKKHTTEVRSIAFLSNCTWHKVFPRKERKLQRVT